jgi:hypothetical protein
VLFAGRFTTTAVCVPAHIVGRGTNLTVVGSFVLYPTAIVADFAVNCTVPSPSAHAIDAVGGMRAMTVLLLRNGDCRRSTVLTNTDVGIVKVAVNRIMMVVIALALGVLSFVRIVIVAVSEICPAQSATCGTVLMLASCSHQVLPAIIKPGFHHRS